MSQTQYSNVVTELLRALPDIRQHYEKMSAELYANGNPHVVYGSIFVEYINALVNKFMGSDHDIAYQRLRDAFCLIEELAASTDFETRCLVETSVLEALLGEKGGVGRFANYMGPETKRLARRVAQRWGLDSELLSD
jgi:hypothetical protein